jgi:hypothetical protein
VSARRGPTLNSVMAPIMLLIGANPMSALPPKAEIRGATRHVCYGPIADIELSQNAGFNFGTLRIGCGPIAGRTRSAVCAGAANEGPSDAAPTRVLMKSRRLIASPRGQIRGIVTVSTTLGKGRADVRSWSKADISQRKRHVRFTPD